MPRPRLAAFLFFAAAATLSAQKSGTNAPAPLRGANSTLSTFNSQFLLDSVRTNDSYSFSMPSNGVRYENWWLRGAYEDVFRLDLGGMLFPLGTNLCSSLWVYTWGKVGARLGDRACRAVATGAPMSAVPGVSQFWSADADGGGKLLTWENFFLNRDTNTPVNVQMELFPSGDFIARSNLVERAYRRVNPDDWDGDGIPNADDLDPLVYDGDFFGPRQTLPEGADTNAYCWIDVVAHGADSMATFTGDGYSSLPDPSFIAKAGATNRDLGGSHKHRICRDIEAGMRTTSREGVIVRAQKCGGDAEADRARPRLAVGIHGKATMRSSIAYTAASAAEPRFLL